MNLASDTDPITDYSNFLPFPLVWKESTHDRKIEISPAAAREFLTIKDEISADAIVAFEDWLTDISIIANE